MVYAVIGFIVLIVLLAINVNVFFRNYKNTTKIYAKIFCFYFLIPHRRLMKKMKDDTIKDHSIERFRRDITLYKRFCRFIVIDNINLEHVINDINITEGVSYYLAVANFSYFLRRNFKCVYNEDYALRFYEKRRIDLDGFLIMRTTIFNLCIMGILYLFRRK